MNHFHSRQWITPLHRCGNAHSLYNGNSMNLAIRGYHLTSSPAQHRVDHPSPVRGTVCDKPLVQHCHPACVWRPKRPCPSAPPSNRPLGKVKVIQRSCHRIQQQSVVAKEACLMFEPLTYIGGMHNNASAEKWKMPFTGLILGLHPANERRRYKITPSLIGWVQT